MERFFAGNGGKELSRCGGFTLQKCGEDGGVEACGLGLPACRFCRQAVAPDDGGEHLLEDRVAGFGRFGKVSVQPCL